MVQTEDYRLYKWLTQKTFAALGFRRHVPASPWAFWVHVDLTDQARIQACEVGICEVLSGMEQFDMCKSQTINVEIPPDTGLAGFCSVQFDCETQVVRLQSIITANKWLSFRLSSAIDDGQ